MPLPYATPARVKSRLGIASSDKDTLLTAMCEEINAYIESVTRRAIGSSSVTNQLIDGHGIHIQDGGYVIDYPHGIRSVDTLEARLTTDGTYSTIPATDYFLRPEDAYRTPGWPAFSIHLTDLPSAGNSVPFIQPAFGAIRLTGDVGWAEMPADLRGSAEVAVSRAFAARQAGYGDDVGPDELGEITVSRFLSSHDWRIIKRYRWEVVEVID